MSENILYHIGNTPLVELKNIGRGYNCRIFAKCEHLNPGGSIKDRIAKSIIVDAESKGILSPGMTLVEATAGNTGLGLAIVAALRGYRIVCVLPEKMSVDKRVALASAGCQVIVTPNAPPSSPDNFRNVAKRLSVENGWFLTDQFNNPANVQIHESATGPEIVSQLPEGVKISAFVCGAGTGGSISGIGRYLKHSLHLHVDLILADPLGSCFGNIIETGEPGVDSKYLVEGIGGSVIPTNLHIKLIDKVVRISDEDSFEMARRLAREEGLFVGGSAGTNVAAAIRLANLYEKGSAIVTLLPDTSERYRAQSWMQASFNDSNITIMLPTSQR